MKQYAWLWLIGTLLFLGLIGSVIPNVAFADDDPEFQLAMSVDGGMAAICNTAKLSQGRHSVQPTVAAYVSASNTNDGGVGVVDSTKHVKVPADGLYDVWITKDKRYICCKPAANGAASTCKGFNYREF